MGKIKISSQSDWNAVAASPPASNAEIVITKDIKFCTAPTVLVLNPDVTLDGDNYTITYGYNNVSGIVNLQGGKVKNLKVDGNHKVGTSFLLVVGTVSCVIDNSAFKQNVQDLKDSVTQFKTNKKYLDFSTLPKIQTNNPSISTQNTQNTQVTPQVIDDPDLQFGEIINVHIFGGNLDNGAFGYFFYNFGTVDTRSKVSCCSSVNVGNTVVSGSSVFGFGNTCTNVEFKKSKTVMDVSAAVQYLAGFCFSNITQYDTFIGCSAEIKHKGSYDFLSGYCIACETTGDNNKMFVDCSCDIKQKGAGFYLFGYGFEVGQSGVNSKAFINCKTDVDNTCDAEFVVGYCIAFTQTNTNPCIFIDCCANLKNKGNCLSVFGYATQISQQLTTFTADSKSSAFVNCKLNMENKGVSTEVVGFIANIDQSNHGFPAIFINCCSTMNSVGIIQEILSGYAINITQDIGDVTTFVANTCAKAYIDCKCNMDISGDTEDFIGMITEFNQYYLDDALAFRNCTINIKNNGMTYVLAGVGQIVNQSNCNKAKAFIDCASVVNSTGMSHIGVSGYLYQNMIQNNTGCCTAFKNSSAEINNNGDLIGIGGFCLTISQNLTKKSKAFTKCSIKIKQEGSSQILAGYCNNVEQNNCDSCYAFCECKTHIENCGCNNVVIGYCSNKISQIFSHEAKSFICCQSCICSNGVNGTLLSNIIPGYTNPDISVDIAVVAMEICGYCDIIFQNGTSGDTGSTGSTGSTGNTGECNVNAKCYAFIDCSADIKNKGTSYGVIAGYCVENVKKAFTQMNSNQAVGFVNSKCCIENIGNNIGGIYGFCTNVLQDNDMTEKIFIDCKSHIKNNGSSFDGLIVGYSDTVIQTNSTDKAEVFIKCVSDIENICTSFTTISGFVTELNQDGNNSAFIKCKSHINNTGYIDAIYGFADDIIITGNNTCTFIECCSDIDTKCNLNSIFGYCDTLDVSNVTTPIIFKNCRSNIDAKDKAELIYGYCEEINVGSDTTIFNESYSIGCYNCQLGSGFIDHVADGVTGDITYLNCYTQIKKALDCCDSDEILTGFELNNDNNESNNLVFTNCYNSSTSTDFAFAQFVDGTVTFNNCYCQPNQKLYNDVTTQNGVKPTIDKYKHNKLPHCCNKCI